MKKNFKRAVSSVLASAMAFSSVTVATVSTTLPFTAVQAFAETTTVASWKSGETLPAAFGAEDAFYANTTEYTVKTSATGVFSDSFVTIAGSTGKDGYTIESTHATDNTGAVKGKKYCVFIPTATGTLNLYTVNSGSSSTKKESIRAYSNLTSNGDGTYSLPSEFTSYDVAGYNDSTINPISIPVTANTPICLYFNNSKTVLLGMTLVGEAGGDDTTTTTDATTTTVATTTTEASTETTTLDTTTTTTEASSETTTAATSWQIKADTAPDTGYEEGVLVYENEYAAVYAAQKLKVQSKPLEVNGRAYTKGFQTSGINTTIDGTTYRLAFKVVAKQSTRVSADTSGGSKNSIFLANDDGTYKNLTGNVGQSETMYADLDAGQTAYIGNGGTNNSMLAVDIKKGPSPVTVTTKLTLGNAATAVPANASVTIGGTTVTSDENGAVVFNGKTSTDYTVTYEANGCRYESVLSIDDDGNVVDTLNLPLISADATVTVKTDDGAVVSGKKVTLSYYDGYKPLSYTATTDENGVATFTGLDFHTFAVTVGGYTSATTEFVPIEGNVALTINDATAKDYATLPADASNANLYVGYAPNSTVTVTYDSVQDAVDAAADGQAIYVAPGTYNEMVTITKNIDIIGNSADDTIITYNDSQSGNDSYAQGSTDKTKFHGDTVAINASVNVHFKNIQIKNTAEGDLGVAQNATALSVYGDNLAATVVLDDCTIWATRDTIFTGKTSAKNEWVFNNCTIAGFQDVVCGTGTVILNDCTWELNLSSDARFFVPNSNSMDANADGHTTMYAENLTINDTTDGGFTAKAYLGRGWGTSGCSLASTTVVVNGYTDNSGKIVTDGVYHGYDTSLANNDGTTLADTNWLVRAKQNENYYTTNKAIDTVAIDTLDTAAVTKDADGDYFFKGVVDSALAKDSNVSYIGFALFNNDGTFVGNTKNDTVYNITGDENTLYTVNYIKNLPTDGCKVKGFVQYNVLGQTFNIMNNVSDTSVAAITDASNDSTTAE